MPKRRKDPSGQARLTGREHRLVEAYVSNGGNGARAAVDAGYSPKHAARAAYQVLARPQVEARLHQRIAQTRITTEEVMGALAQQLRADPADCLDEHGCFDLDRARKSGLGPLLKIRASVRRERQANGQMRDVAQTTTVELDSSVAAAIHLARAKGLDSTPVYGARDIVQSVECLIAAQMQKHNLTRSAVVRRLLEIRPDIAEFLM